MPDDFDAVFRHRSARVGAVALAVLGLASMALLIVGLCTWGPVIP